MYKKRNHTRVLASAAFRLLNNGTTEVSVQKNISDVCFTFHYLVRVNFLDFKITYV